MTTPDPWLVLGLPSGSSLAEARSARRRLAKQLHPDLHAGKADLAMRMSLVNRALAEIEAGWEKGRDAAPTTPVVPDHRGAASPRPGGGSSRQSAHASGPTDPDSFSVDCLPVEAFEALFLATYGLGDILGTEDPYLLEVYLTEPCPCFCRLTLVPEAGGSLVTVELSPAAESLAAPEPWAVVEVLVAELNSLVAG